MTLIVTGTNTVPLKLTQSGQNPVTVVGTALITTTGAYAIGGSSLLPWSVTNRGTIKDTGSSGVGVSLAGGGTVVKAWAGQAQRARRMIHDKPTKLLATTRRRTGLAGITVMG